MQNFQYFQIGVLNLMQNFVLFASSYFYDNRWLLETLIYMNVIAPSIANKITQEA